MVDLSMSIRTVGDWFKIQHNSIICTTYFITKYNLSCICRRYKTALVYGCFASTSTIYSDHTFDFLVFWKLSRSSAAKLINYWEEKCFTLRFSVYATLFRKVAQNWLARRRHLYLTTPNTHNRQTDIHASVEIRTHSLSRRAAADLRLRPRDGWDRRYKLYAYILIRYV